MLNYAREMIYLKRHVRTSVSSEWIGYIVGDIRGINEFQC